MCVYGGGGVAPGLSSFHGYPYVKIYNGNVAKATVFSTCNISSKTV